MREKISRRGFEREVVYDEKTLEILRRKRAEAEKILGLLAGCGVRACIHGSLARGDVSEESDVDIVVDHTTPPSLLTACIEKGYRIYRGEIVMATPSRTPVLYLYLDPGEKLVVSKYLGRPSRSEQEFHIFSGALDLEGLRSGRRVPGVSKRLTLILPTERGYVERSIVHGGEAEVARLLGISQETVAERIRVLTRRDEHGRTGVFLKIPIEGGEPVEKAVEELCRRSPAARRRLRSEALC